MGKVTRGQGEGNEQGRVSALFLVGLTTLGQPRLSEGAQPYLTTTKTKVTGDGHQGIGHSGVGISAIGYRQRESADEIPSMPHPTVSNGRDAVAPLPKTARMRCHRIPTSMHFPNR